MWYKIILMHHLLSLKKSKNQGYNETLRKGRRIVKLIILQKHLHDLFCYSFSKLLTVFETMAPILKTLHTKPENIRTSTTC